MTKQQLLDGLQAQGLEQDAMDAVKTVTSSMSEELSPDDMKVVMKMIDEMIATEEVIEKSLEDRVDATLRAQDGILDALDEYVESASAQTISDIETAKSIAG